MTLRSVTHRYLDPLDQVWLTAAAALGLRIERDADVYASTDGRGALSVAPPGALDADDCLAQIIFHELCHAAVQGEQSFSQPDWGMRNTSDADDADYGRDAVREHACLRLQAALARRHGLRAVLAPTTDFRVYYDALPLDPLADGEDPSIPLARAGLSRAARRPLQPVLDDALRRTAAIHAALAGCAPPGSPPLLGGPVPPRHPAGPPLHEDRERTCGGCAFFAAPQRAERGRCRHDDTAATPLVAGQSACVLHTPAPLSCLACGACCRHAYDAVLVPKSSRFARRHPGLVEHRGDVTSVRRGPGGARCAALMGPEHGPYACIAYADRPPTCRDFTVGSANCAEARRRVGLAL